MDILVLGNYCHDTLVRPTGCDEVLGGSSSYISNAFAGAGIDFALVSKVGRDFLYEEQVRTPPLVDARALTTHFIDTFHGEIRNSVVKTKGPLIFPEDLPKARAKIGIAAGVLDEVTPETLVALRAQVDYLICDIQGLIRNVKANGELDHVHFQKSSFFSLLPMIDMLKANRFEYSYLNEIDLGKTKLVITEGSKGSLLIEEGLETRIPSPKVTEVDATGAGDSYVAGFAIGLVRKLSLKDAVSLGNRYGAFAVQSVGVPDFTQFK